MRLSLKLVAPLLVLSITTEASAGLQTALRTLVWGNPVANYNPLTGSITLTNSLTFETEAPELIRRFEIVSLGDPLIFALAHSPNGGTVELLNSPSGIAWSAAGGVFHKPFNAGNVVPPCTPVRSLEFRYGVEFRLGIDGRVFLPATGPIKFVPEPSAFAIVTSSLLASVVIRRRRPRRQC